MSIEKILEEFDPELVYNGSERDMPRLLVYATTHADVEDLLSLTDGGVLPKGRSFGTRRAFCEAVGIGESTLAGWLKERRLPPLARAVVGLLHLFHADLLSKEAYEQYSKRNEIVVSDGDSFMIVDVSRGMHQPGRIVARNIPDKETAFRLISHNELRYAVKLALGELESAGEAGHKVPDGLLVYLEGFLDQRPHGLVMTELGSQTSQSQEELEEIAK
ncbi:MAG: hypothetical protein ACT4N9_00525 [Paracoccaceae bacterium]